MQKKKIKIVITSCHRWSYFNWFILGFYELEKQGLIDLSFEVSFPAQLLRFIRSEKICLATQLLFLEHEKDSYNLKGYVLLENGTKKIFSIDSADSPFLFSSKDLEEVDVYFKMQCPIEINNNGFRLTNGILIPWLDHEHEDKSISNLTTYGERKKIDISKYSHKIKPLMVGPRYLSRGLSFYNLRRGYDNYRKNASLVKKKRIMCYFGNAYGPTPKENLGFVDYDNESSLMGFLQGKVTHPNEKRAKVAYLLKKMDNCDSRLISTSSSDNGRRENKELIIPMKDFCKHISEFEYNVNISGYRLSIPNRFIESFMVGTAIFTDKLAVKWYLPFENEVVESVELGYLPDSDVEWNTYIDQMQNLVRPNAGDILKQYEDKWEPQVVAKYIIKTIIEI